MAKKTIKVKPSIDWEVMNNQPIRLTYSGADDIVEVVLPDPALIKSSATQILIEVTDVTNEVSFSSAEGILINGKESADADEVGTFLAVINNSGNWAISGLAESGVAN